MSKTSVGVQTTFIELQQERSQVINSLRFPMALGVVFLHAGLLSEEIKVKADEGIWWMLRTYDDGINVLFSVAVPLFFMISSYLFFRSFREHWSWDSYKEKLHRRVYTLLIPYIIWNVIGAIDWAQNEYRLGHSLNDYFSGYTIWGFLKHFWQSGVHCDERMNILGMQFMLDYPADTPLWFVRDLMVMIVLVPLFYFIIKKIGLWLPLLLFPLFILDIRLNIQGFSTVAFFFYSIGAWASLKNIDFTNLSVKGLKYFVPLAALFFIIVVYAKAFNFQTEEIWKNIFIIAGCVALIGVFTLLQRAGRVKFMIWLSSASFFIYAAHAFGYLGALQWSRKLLILFFGIPTSEFTAIIMCFANPIIATALCVICYKLLAHYIPRFTAIICGGRV